MKPLFRLAVRDKPERELDEELAFHLDMRTRELIAQGYSAEAARAEALRRFGDVAAARADIHRTDLRRSKRVTRTEALSELRQDLAFALRALRRAPAYTMVAALTLALGIGANTAIFSVVRGILLRPLPFEDPGRLVLITANYRGGSRFIPYLSPANLADFSSQNRSLTSLLTLEEHSAVLTGAGDPERLRGFDVSGDYFALLGVRPIAGRLTFRAGESGWPPAKVVVLSETIWRSRFGSDPGLVNRMITLNNERYQVVGIAPADQSFPKSQLWFPWSFDPKELANSRGAIYLLGLGRLKPGIGLAGAQADFDALAARLSRDFPDQNKGFGTRLVPLRNYITGNVQRPLYILLGGVGFVLLIACANVANLALVRGIAREGELAVRTALGAGRGRLVRQLTTESLVLAGLGTLLGLGLAWVGMRALLGAAPESIPRLDAVRIDGLVLGFTLLAALLTSILFGLLPARLVVRPDLAGTLREAARGGTHSSNRARRLLVVAEVALAVMMLAGAGLLIRSFGKLLRVDPGFRTEGSLAFSLSLPDAKYPERQRQAAFVDQLLEKVRSIPGVQSAGTALGMPLSGFSWNFSMIIAGRPPVQPSETPSAEVRVASPDYFVTMGIPIVKGRGFLPSDRAGARPVLLIAEEAARQFFPAEDPIGKHVKFGWGRGNKVNLEGDIVGVVGDLKLLSLAETTRPQFWAPFDQWPVSSFTVVLHTSRDPEGVLPDARRVVRELDPDLALSQVKTLDQVVADSVAQPRFYMLLLAAFAGVAVLLSSIGIYGVIAYLAERRVKEIGIRIALGASRTRVMRMIVSEGTLLAAIGVTVGLLGSFALGGVLRSLLFEVEPSDPLTLVGVVVLLGVVAVFASGLPALRAARVDPAATMRTE